MPYEYSLFRSKRKSLAIEIRPDLQIYVRAPNCCPQKDIDEFLSRREKWISLHLDKMRTRKALRPEPSEEEQAEYTRLACERIPQKLEHFGKIMGLSPSGLRITGAKTRFGSCSGKNRLCFSWRLMQYPERAIDYVVVHELSHLVHKNHGRQFYALVASVLPDYKERKKLLRD